MSQDFAKTIREQILQKQLERDQSLIAFQQMDQSIQSMRQRIMLLDGALAQLRELEAMFQRH